MPLEWILVVVMALAGWQAQQIFTRRGPRRRTYALMLAGCALAAIAAIAGLHSPGGEPIAEMVGAAAIGAYVLMAIVPILLERVTRWAVATDRLGLALRLLGLREHLQPGMGAAEEKDALGAYGELREGKPGRVIDSLKAARAAAPTAEARRGVDERMVVALLTARRFAEAAEYFERTIDGVPGPVSAHVLVEMVRAYGEIGALDKAADLMRRIEESPMRAEPMLAPLVARARLVFLAFAGRVEPVAAMVGRQGPLGGMPPSTRAFWLGIARRQAGDIPGARQALSAAIEASMRDVRASRVAREELEALGKAPAELPVYPDAVMRVIDEVSQRALSSAGGHAPHTATVPRLEGVGVREVPVTVGLIAANVLAAGLVAALVGSSMDPSVLADAGANLRAATRAGEWWRLVSSMFLHVGLLHLAVNMWSLWVLGRFVEQIVGPRRFFVIYMLAGVGGSLASAFVGQTGLSAGASGAVFGVLGAAIAELGLRRKTYPDRWRRAVLRSLVITAVANLALGEIVRMVDQAAHLGGLVGGALVTAALAPRGRAGRTAAARVATHVLVAAGLLAIVGSAVMTARTTPSQTLERVGWARVDSDGVSLELPKLWQGEASMVEVGLAYLPGPFGEVPPPELIEAAEAKQPGRRVEPRFAATGWVGVEHVTEDNAELGTTLSVRHATMVRALDHGLVRVQIATPDRHAAAIAPAIRRMLESIRVGR